MFLSLDFLTKYPRTNLDEIRAEFANNGRDCDYEADQEIFFPAPSMPIATSNGENYFRNSYNFNKRQPPAPKSTPVNNLCTNLPIDPDKLKFILPYKYNVLPSARSRRNSESGQQVPKSPDKGMECVFCRNNKQPIEIVRSHMVRDQSGVVTCPTLREFECPICGATGDRAHTVKYCPRKKIFTMEDAEVLERAGITKMYLSNGRVIR